MIILRMTVKIDPQKQQEFLQSMQEFVIPIHSEDAGLTQSVCQRLDEDTTYCYCVEWASKAEMEADVHTDLFRAIVGAMSVLGEIQDCKLITSSGIEGLEALDMS